MSIYYLFGFDTRELNIDEYVNHNNFDPDFLFDEETEEAGEEYREKNSVII